ncbi:MAG: amino acid adenylation domain-containing protein [Chloroflexi bacterium]|nr:amino acid adenylation domain-containing protein [Chloroflexota bacterium]MCC6892490.1 amino acid adenylation domain-containing protein [Anaerolineae bacterium]
MSDKIERGIKDLSPEEKRALLAKLLAEKASQNKSEYALSYGQRALWFIHELAPESTAYHIGTSYRVTATVNIDALKHAVQAVINRQPTLRTTYVQRDDRLVQIIQPQTDAPFEHVDASGWDEAELYHQVVQSSEEPFDLLNGPVIRFVLFTKAPTEHVLLITIHHIAFDGFSLFPLLTDLKAAYSTAAAGGTPALPPLKLTYLDYVDQQAKLLASEKGRQLKEYWLKQLEGELPVLNLPADLPRPLIQTYNGATVERFIEPEQTAQLKQFAMSESVTLFMVMLAVFQSLLHRYSGQNDVLIGTPNSNRDVTEFGDVVGYFVDPLVLRSTVEAGGAFRGLLAQTRKTVLDALSHQGYPFMLLVEELVSAHDPSRSPLFQVTFNLHSMSRIESSLIRSPGDAAAANTLSLEAYKIPQEEGQFDLMLEVIETQNALWVGFKYNTDLFTKETIDRMAGHYITLLNAALAQPETPLAQLPLLSEVERRQILTEWNATQLTYPMDKCVHQLFEEQVQRTPDAVAIYFEDQNLTYDQLNRRANQLAHHLRGLGIGSDKKVGIHVERSLDMMVSLFAVHKAGGGYVPLDPTYPEERVAFMLEDAQVAVLLTQEHNLQRLPATNAQVVCIDRDWTTIAQQPDSNPTNQTQPQNLCYMIYTSGSTGKPKGVMIEHRNVVNFFTGMDPIIPHQPAGIWLAVTSTSFDISVLELFWTLTRGFTVVVLADYTTDTPKAVEFSIHALIDRYRVTHLQCTPAMADMLLVASDSAAALGKLETMLVGGEALSLSLATRLHERVKRDLINMYGPTETTIWSSTYRVDEPTLNVPIGKPIANTSMYILDAHMQPVPVGIAGELFIGGAGVVRGYWNRPELTAERFILDPFSIQSGARMYKTGDLARYLPDGNIEFLGRNDFQVKIRGHRIELGEIETLLDHHLAVQKAVVIAREDVPGDKQLVAYLILNNGQQAEAADFRNHLRETLPEYMIPSAFVTLDAFPLTPNRKVDRKALPIPEVQKRAEVETELLPTKPMEVTIANIWRDILKVDSISIYDNFFDLGGHSLQVMQVVTRLESETGIKINPVTMRMQTLSQLAFAVENEVANPTPVQAEPARPQKGLFGSFKRFVTGKQDKG